MEHKYFPTIVCMFKHLAEKHDQLDIDQSLRMPEYYFVTKSGEVHAHANMAGFCAGLNEVFNAGIHTNLSYSFSYQYVMFFGEEGNEAEETAEDEPLIALNAGDEQAISLDDAGIDEDQEADVPEQDSVDWGWVEGLENTKEGKQELKQYAAKFGVTLKGNKTLANFIVEFKEGLEVK